MQSKIIVDFSRFSFCFRTVTIGKYTNKLKNSTEFFEKFNILITDVIPFISQFDSSNIYTNKHCNILNQNKNNKEYSLCLKIIEQLNKETDNLDFEVFKSNHIYDYNMCELGSIKGIRLIGTLCSNVFSVLFIDYHHQVFPNKNYNEKDILKNTFCPVTNYGGEND